VEISVVVPTKDRVEYLKRGLPTVLMQKEVQEIIVVVDGSTDGTLEFLSEFCKGEPRVRYLDNGINRGTPFSKNRGIAAAECEYTFVGEDDLELTEGYFGILGEHMMRTKADVICSRNIFRHPGEITAAALERANALEGPYVDRKFIDLQTGMDIKNDQPSDLIASPMLAKTEVFRAVRFDMRYQVNFWREETDFQISARESGYTLFSCPHAVCFNQIILNDRGGAHAVIGIRRTIWIIINNWRFIKKHEKFISENFDIGHPVIYIAKFSARRLWLEVIMPLRSKLRSYWTK
jgi:GT2 family glycosyltransferase